MTHDEAFLAAIAAEPADDTHRLVYADWLEEHDNPERAEFIRVQCALARNSDGKGDLPAREIARLKVRERVLLSRNKKHWLQPLRDLEARTNLHGEFSRGFVNDITIDAAVFIDRGEELLRVSPCITLDLDKVGGLADRLAGCPHLARARRLSFGRKGSITPDGLWTVLTSPHLTDLRDLSLHGISLAQTNLWALAGLPSLAELRRISVPIGTPHAAWATLLGRLRHLETLSLSSKEALPGTWLAEVLASLSPDCLRVLVIEDTPLGSDGMATLAAARHLTGLTKLWLRWCKFDARAMETLAGATHLTGVTELHLYDRIGPEGGIALATWPGLRAVRTLGLDSCGLGPEGVIALARSPHLGALMEYRSSSNNIDDAAIAALAERDVLSSLRVLSLPRNNITAEGVRAVATSPHLAGLRHLALEYNPIGDDGADAIATSASLRRLRWLTIGDCGVGQAAARRLIATLPDLSIFHTQSSFLVHETLEALRTSLVAGGSDEAVNAATEDYLVQAILEDPDDPKARENYGNFLAHVGSPWGAALRKWGQNRQPAWLAPLAPWVEPISDAAFDQENFLRAVRFIRPLPDDVAATLARFPPLTLLPLEVQRGNMTGAGAFQVLAQRRCLARMRRLEFASITATELAHLLASPHLTALEELAIGWCGMDDSALRLLASSAALGKLRSLDLGWLPEGREEDAAVANRVTSAGLAILGASPNLQTLRSLGLRGNRLLGDSGVTVLLEGPALRNLVTLDLRSTGLTAAGARRLAESPALTSLKTLHLGGNDSLGDALEPLRTRLGSGLVV
jgi:uncharacterized protein (TIGR02996 family)